MMPFERSWLSPPPVRTLCRNSSFFKDDEREGDFPLVRLFEYPPETSLRDVRHMDVTFVIPMYPGEVYSIDPSHRFPEQPPPSDNKYLIMPFLFECREALFQRVEYAGVRHGIIPLSGDDYVYAAGQDPADGFEGFSSHDDGMSFSVALEPGKILGYMPGQLVPLADYTVSGNRHDDR